MKEPKDDILKQFGFEDDKALREALSELDHLKVKPVLSREDAWARFEQSVKSRDSAPQKTKTFAVYSIAWKAAASILLILAVWFGFNKWNHKNYITANNQNKEIILPDNSSVILNAASHLKYDKFRWKASRSVELTGEALFKVTPGSSFEISTLGKTIRVLGTEFNVFSRADYFEVKCISGKVEVQIQNTGKILLTQGTAVKKGKGDKAPVKFDIANNGANWIKGDFYYNDADLNVVFDEIARQFNVYISRDSLDRRYTGYFNKSSLKEALNNVCLPMGLNYSILKDTIIIK